MQTVIENEKDVLAALQELRDKNVNALVIFLGNFGPEGPTSMLAQRFDGPVMIAAAAEETQEDLFGGRGDALCGVLNLSYNLGLRGLNPYIPEYPVGTAAEVAGMIAGFVPVARVMLGLKKLKIFSFGPRPQDFLACNAPVKPLYDLGVEIMENSELDLYDYFQSVKADPKIRAIVRDMAKELGSGAVDLEPSREARPVRGGLDEIHGAEPRGRGVRRLRQQVLAGLREIFRVRALLRQFPPGGPRHPGGLRGGYLRRPERVHGGLRDGVSGDAPRHQQLRAARHGTRRRKRRSATIKPTDLFMGFHCGNTPSVCLVGGASSTSSSWPG